MTNISQHILLVFPWIGILAIIGAFITFYLNKNKELEFKKLEQRARRYKSCLLYMDAYFNIDHIKYLSIRQPDIHTKEDVISYLKAEYHEMILYASKSVILSLQVFINEPTRDNFLNTVLCMRKDLWVRKEDLTLNEITL